VRYWDTPPLARLWPPVAPPVAVARVPAPHGDIVTWWGTTVECESALARREREGHPVTRGRELHELLAATWREVAPSAAIRLVARRVVRTHALRGADAFQLAAALSAADGDPSSLVFVTYDTRLAEAASKEGFRVLSP